MKLELKTLSFKTLFPDYNIHEQELEYGGILGWGEVSNFFPYKFVCFRKGNNKETAAISLTEIETKSENTGKAERMR